MKPLLPIFSFIFVFSLFVLPVSAGSALDVSDKSDFSSSVRNFSQGQTIYVRIQTDNPGDNQKVLNLRDNNYNLIKTYGLTRAGNTYSASFSAPSGDGYYSLEAKIESSGQNTTSVKTIKVGNASGASVKVNVSNKVAGQSSLNKDENGDQKSERVRESKSDQKSGEESPSPEVSPSPTGEQVNQESEQGGNFWGDLGHFLAQVLDFVLPFKTF